MAGAIFAAGVGLECPVLFVGRSSLFRPPPSAVGEIYTAWGPGCWGARGLETSTCHFATGPKKVKSLLLKPGPSARTPGFFLPSYFRPDAVESDCRTVLQDVFFDQTKKKKKKPQAGLRRPAFAKDDAPFFCLESRLRSALNGPFRCRKRSNRHCFGV